MPSNKLMHALVHWVDAEATLDENVVRPADVLCPCIVVENHPDYIVISSEIFQDGSYRTRLAIPKGMIKAIIPIHTRVPKIFQDWVARSNE